MSRVFVESFFPAITALLKSHSSTQTHFDRAFPREVAELCPESVITVLSRQIRNPVLFTHAFIGAIVGFVGSFVQQNRMWSLAYALFGWMNAVALPLHCFLPQTDALTDRSRLEPWLWMLDMYFTGASSAAMITACRREYTKDRRLTEMEEWALWNIAGVCGVAMFLLFDMTLPLELWYLIPTLVAGGALTPRLIRDVSGNRSRFTLAACSVAAVMIQGILVLDAPLCYRGLQIADAFMAHTVVFAACNLAFIGMFFRLRESQPPNI